MKRRLVTATLVLPALLAMCALMATNLHRLLLGEKTFIYRPAAVMEVLLCAKKAQLFFLALAACTLLLVIACLVSGAGVHYDNSTVYIAPKIRIPVPAGHGEYGTAWLLPKKELRRTFAQRKLKEIKKLQKEMRTYGAKDAAVRRAAGVEQEFETLLL